MQEKDIIFWYWPISSYMNAHCQVQPSDKPIHVILSDYFCDLSVIYSSAFSFFGLISHETPTPSKGRKRIPRTITTENLKLCLNNSTQQMIFIFFYYITACNRRSNTYYWEKYNTTHCKLLKKQTEQEFSTTGRRLVSWVICFGWFKLVGESVLVLVDIRCCLLVLDVVGWCLLVSFDPGWRWLRLLGVGDGLVGRGITRALGQKNSQYLL